MRFRRSRTALSCGVLAFLAAAVACEEPTQVTIRITTTEECAKLSDVHTFVAPDPSEAQARFRREVSTGASDRCERDGFVGTLVVTPGGANGSVLVAAGVRADDGTPAPPGDKCADPEVAKRCIIARRTFSFIENKPLLLPIDLDPLCIGQSCDPASTCFKGTCVSATVVCVGAECGLAEENPGGVGEGGANEASSGDAAYDADLDGPPFEDVNVSDTSPPTDATADGGVDASAYPCQNVDAGNTYVCNAATGYGVVTAGQCDAGTGCTCSCRCPSGAVVGCTNGMTCGLMCP